VVSHEVRRELEVEVDCQTKIQNSEIFLGKPNALGSAHVLAMRFILQDNMVY
jgi:hypothetical protein